MGSIDSTFPWGGRIEPDRPSLLPFQRFGFVPFRLVDNPEVAGGPTTSCVVKSVVKPWDHEGTTKRHSRRTVALATRARWEGWRWERRKKKGGPTWNKTTEVE